MSDFPAWPLPGLLLVGGILVPGDTTERTEVEGGPPIVRRRYTAAVDSLSGSRILTGAEWQILRTFGQTTLAGWALPFSWTAADTDAETVYRFKAPPSASCVVPHHDPLQRLWEVTIALEVLPS